MDAKITKTRLAHMLSYDWLKIVGVAVALIIFWNLLFTMTATRARPSQQFTVFNHYANAAFSDEFHDDLAQAVNGGKTFSYEVIELTTNDLTIAGDQVHTLIDARLQTDEGDVMFIPNINDPSTKVEPTVEGGEATYTTYMQSFFNGWFHYVANVDDYLNGMRIYLSAYYNADGTLNKEKVRAEFLARIKRNNDKRFKKDDKIEAGVLQEYERIEKYAVALKEFEGYLADGTVTLTHLQVKDSTGKVYREGNFAVNLCPEGGKTEKLKEQVYYYTEDNAKTANLNIKGIICKLF